MPKCLYCELWDVTPETAAGLCDLCAAAIRKRYLAPVDDGLGLRICQWSGLVGPLDEGKPFDPARLIPDGTTAELAAIRGELVNFYNGPYGVAVRKAKETLAAIRGCGVRVWLHTGLGSAQMDKPECVPFPLLVQYVYLQSVIEDELTVERANEIRARECEAQTRAERSEFLRQKCSS